MSDPMDRFIDGLQDQIYQETRAAYGDLAFERWQNMRHMASMENPDGYSRITGSCGGYHGNIFKI
jgi:nitrogen fixation NifU-like protein